jgi:hypothetical protein
VNETRKQPSAAVSQSSFDNFPRAVSIECFVSIASHEIDLTRFIKRNNVRSNPGTGEKYGDLYALW